MVSVVLSTFIYKLKRKIETMNNISITTKDLRLAFQATQELSGIKLPIKASYWVSRLNAKLKSEYDISEKTRLALVKENGETDENGNSFIRGDSKEAIATFIAAWTPIEDTVIELETAPQISIDLFGNFEVQPAIISALSPFITE